MILDTFVIHGPRAKALRTGRLILTGYFKMLPVFLCVSHNPFLNMSEMIMSTIYHLVTKV